MRLLTSIVCFLIVVVSSQAQTPEEKAIAFLTKVAAVYEGAQSYDMTIVLQSSGIDDKSAQVNSQQYRSVKSGDHFYIETPTFATMINDSYTVMIDHLQKQIQLQVNRQDDAVNELKNSTSFLPDLEALSTSILSVEENVLEFKIRFQESGVHYDVSEYAFTKADYQLKSVKYVITEPTGGQAKEIVLQYSDKHIHQNVDPNLFELSAIAVEYSGEWKLSQRYQGYSLINTLK